MKKRRLPVGVFERRGRGGRSLFYFGVQVGEKWVRRPAPENTVAGAVLAREEALARAARGEAAILERLAPRGPLTVGQVVAHHVAVLESSERSATALALIKRQGDKLIERIGAVEVAALDEAAFHAYRAQREAEWRTKRKRSLRTATVNRELQFLRAALNTAKEDELLASHAFARLSRAARHRVLPEEIADGAREFRGVEDAHVDKMLEELPEPYRAPVRVLFLTGAREAEVFNLDRERVLPNAIRFVLTKGRKVREFPLTRELRELIGEGEPGLVFPGPGGRSLLPAFGKAWQRARKRAKLSWFKPHHLRGERASRLSEDGATEGEIRVLLGWSDKSPVPTRYIRPGLLRLQLLAEKTGARREVGGRVVRHEQSESAPDSSQISARAS